MQQTRIRAIAATYKTVEPYQLVTLQNRYVASKSKNALGDSQWQKDVDVKFVNLATSELKSGALTTRVTTDIDDYMIERVNSKLC